MAGEIAPSRKVLGRGEVQRDDFEHCTGLQPSELLAELECKVAAGHFACVEEMVGRRRRRCRRSLGFLRRNCGGGGLGAIVKKGTERWRFASSRLTAVGVLPAGGVTVQPSELRARMVKERRAAAADGLGKAIRTARSSAEAHHQRKHDLLAD